MKRRTDFTFKHNSNLGRYGWLRLTPAYSLKVVQRYLPSVAQGQKVLDPFCGSGTTPLVAGYEGIDAEAIEINPFLAWFANVKTRVYNNVSIEQAKEITTTILFKFSDNNCELSNLPSIKNINRWWPDPALFFLRAVKGEILQYKEKGLAAEVIDLLYVSFCRTLIKISNAAFNHQSLSFKENDTQLSFLDEYEHYKGVFWNDVLFVTDSALDNPISLPHIHQGDARNVTRNIQTGIDIVITSPPYPNRISYIRELRPYMYWMGYLNEAREAGELDWHAIGGTWGVATSRLTDWVADNTRGYYPEYFNTLLDEIQDSNNKNGKKMANYIARYFEDIVEHFRNLTKVLNKGARVYYVVGNSTFYDVLVPVEKLYQGIMEMTGFSQTNIEVLRKRNSKKELYEFVVSSVYT